MMLTLTDIESDTYMETIQSTCWLHEKTLAKKDSYYCSATHELTSKSFMATANGIPD